MEKAACVISLYSMGDTVAPFRIMLDALLHVLVPVRRLRL
jgi:hypothetical protein